jgi:phage gp16-like protein
MIQYEIAKSGATEDQKLQRMTEDLKKKEHDSELHKAKTKLQIAENAKKTL